MAPETRYARSGDVHIAYQVVGEHPLDLVYVPSWISQVEHYWEEPTIARYFNRLASFSRLPAPMRTARAIPIVRHSARCTGPARPGVANRLNAPTVRPVKTLHTAYRVTDLAVSLDFYSALGYEEVGRISLGDGATLTVLKFPGEEVVTLELVHRPADGPVQIGTGFSHLVVQVDELAGTIATLLQRGLQPEPEQHPAGPDGPRTSWLTDPDGYRIELVQWPAGHADGITAADFP
jgi:lactoylglutathione lyase